MLFSNNKKKKQKQVAPKTVQQAIPYVAVYPDNGIIEVKQGLFSRSYLLQDINYSVAKEADQIEIFTKYGRLLNLTVHIIFRSLSIIRTSTNLTSRVMFY